MNIKGSKIFRVTLRGYMMGTKKNVLITFSCQFFDDVILNKLMLIIKGNFNNKFVIILCAKRIFFNMH